jgi:flagellar basal-body rod protein FlgC
MDASSAFAISASGLRAQRLRLEVIAANLANAQSTRTPEGGPYRRRDVVLRSMPGGEVFDDLLPGGTAPSPGVEVTRVVTDQRPPRMVFDPGHPDANSQGYVAMPNIDVVTEMVDMMAASRAYEANVTAINASKRVLEAALNIGRG